MTRTVIPLAFAALLLAPASARAACGVATNRALYESPEVQVYRLGNGDEEGGQGSVVACLRATGKTRTLGFEHDGGDAADSAAGVNLWGVYGGRWVWSNLLSGNAKSLDSLDTLLDLRTGAKASLAVTGGLGVEDVALPGVLIGTGNGLTAHFTDGHDVKLSDDPTADSPAVAGSRVYWRTGAVAHSALLDVPQSDPARKPPLARKIGRCVPRPGARLLLSDDSGFVLTRQGGNLWTCEASGGRKHKLGKVSDPVRAGTGRVGYLRAGMVGFFNTFTGNRKEYPGTAFAANAKYLLIAAQDGLHLRSKLIAPGPVSEPALNDDDAYGYWLDSSGTPRLKHL